MGYRQIENKIKILTCSFRVTKNHNLRIFNVKTGFTLVELLIVIAITLILAMAAVPIYGNLQVSSQLNENTSLLIQNLRTAQERSMSRVNNSSHGIKFFSDNYVLYQGSSYGTRTQVYDRVTDLGSAVSLQWSLSGSGQLDEINFSKSLGVPDMTGTVTLSHSVGDMSVINTNEFGAVEKQ